ncbi:hypothetical protein QWY75_02150 [Pontixanthobacter aestiaquae]|uniref:Uncharacterized protein n=1 Tax=Pontixanthobacter aestiaquae TaxID=1509367 RepID=A0A844Z7W2_9SPHN|nr:hypothetical protein [Pontixanthobacter aestiaquae]MDN3645004.1 hypothetical protein [Pontixanthobacter aestiaquae]MXO83995.1 hypothetical protein [Pontixanthobacter aestiaquae]
MQESDTNIDQLAVALRTEVDSILLDPLFVRAPIQSKLLVYLCKQAVEGDHDLTQYAIAVDGLGKPDDYDLHNDSYPRVQVSRLRANLASYYSRNEPVGDHCVYIRQGDYRLRMGSRKNAYPDTLRSQRAVPEIADSIEQPVLPKTSYNDSGQKKAISDRTTFFANRHFLVFGAGAIMLAAVAAVFGTQFQSADAMAPPSIELEVTGAEDFNETIGSTSLGDSVKRVARQQLNQSFVSNLISRQNSEEAQRDYLVSIDLGPGISTPNAEITLRTNTDSVLYSEVVPYTGDADAFLRELSANLVHLTAPNGVIASSEISQVSGKPRTPYHCFISIEANRARGPEMVKMLDSCIKRFPDDRFAAFWYARKAYGAYQKDIAAGLPVTRAANGWQFVTKALEIDQYNAFANFVAAKVSAAEGSCDESRIFIERAKERGTSYPTLIAAAESEASGCQAVNSADIDDEHSQIEVLIEQNPAPDALLHNYMMYSALSIKRPDLAKLVAGRLVIENPEGAVERASDLMRKSIEDPDYFRKNKESVRSAVSLFVWNARALDTIFSELEKT